MKQELIYFSDVIDALQKVDKATTVIKTFDYLLKTVALNNPEDFTKLSEQYYNVVYIPTAKDAYDVIVQFLEQCPEEIKSYDK